MRPRYKPNQRMTVCANTAMGSLLVAFICGCLIAQCDFLNQDFETRNASLLKDGRGGTFYSPSNSDSIRSIRRVAETNAP